LLASLSGTLGIKASIQTSQEVRARVMHDASSFYVLLFNESQNQYIPTKDQARLPEGEYDLTNMTDEFSPLPPTNSKSWATGYPITLSPLEFRVYKLKPTSRIN
jgi:hypothetical protein